MDFGHLFLSILGLSFIELEKNARSLHHVERKNGGEKNLCRDLMEGAKIGLFSPIFKGFKHILVSIIIAYYAQKNMLR